MRSVDILRTTLRLAVVAAAAWAPMDVEAQATLYLRNEKVENSVIDKVAVSYGEGSKTREAEVKNVLRNMFAQYWESSETMPADTLETLRKQTAEIKSRNKELERELQSMTKEESALRSNIEGAHSELARTTAAIEAECTNASEQLALANEEKREQLQRLEATIAQQYADIAEREARVAALNEQMQQLEAQSGELDSAAAELEEQRRRNEAVADAVGKRKDSAQAVAQNIAAAMKSTNGRLSSMDRTNIESAISYFTSNRELIENFAPEQLPQMEADVKQLQQLSQLLDALSQVAPTVGGVYNAAATASLSRKIDDTASKSNLNPKQREEVTAALQLLAKENAAREALMAIGAVIVEEVMCIADDDSRVYLSTNKPYAEACANFERLTRPEYQSLNAAYELLKRDMTPGSTTVEMTSVNTDERFANYLKKWQGTY